MYELVETGGKWELHYPKGFVQNSMANIVTRMVKPKDEGGFGFDIDEVSLAIEEMGRRQHNAVHFGVLKGFIFSFNKEKNNEF